MYRITWGSLPIMNRAAVLFLLFNNRLEHENENDRQERLQFLQQLKIKRRVLRDMSNAFEMPPQYFRQFYRFGVIFILKVILQMLLILIVYMFLQAYSTCSAWFDKLTGTRNCQTRALIHTSAFANSMCSAFFCRRFFPKRRFTRLPASNKSTNVQ